MVGHNGAKHFMKMSQLCLHLNMIADFMRMVFKNFTLLNIEGMKKIFRETVNVKNTNINSKKALLPFHGV
jgi:hypothetical protein